MSDGVHSFFPLWYPPRNCPSNREIRHMCKILLFLVGCILSTLALAAQYTPPPPQSSNSAVGFWASGKTSWLAGTTTTSMIALSTAASSAASQVQVYNAGTTLAYVACGGSTITASVGAAGTSTSDYPIAPGVIVVITVGANTGYCAGIFSSGSGALYFTPGSGL